MQRRYQQIDDSVTIFEWCCYAMIVLAVLGLLFAAFVHAIDADGKNRIAALDRSVPLTVREEIVKSWEGGRP